MNSHETMYSKPENVYHDHGRLIDEGNDFEVYAFGEEFVVKYPSNSRQDTRPYNVKSLDFYNNLIADQEKLKAILGDTLAETFFFPPNENEKANYRIIQKKFAKTDFLSSLDETSLEEFIRTHREEFKDLLAKANQVYETFGIPLDLTPRNLVFHNGKLIFVENDSPTERAKFMHIPTISEKIKKDIARQEHWEKLVS